jgi:tetratricopeptide (TPR) repeat protein
LEAKEGNHAAARRCFSRALDADIRNVAAVTAWALMEEELDYIQDARAIFERALTKFSPGSSEKMILWRAYELMEQRRGNVAAAQEVYQRSMREAITMQEDSSPAEQNRINWPTMTETRSVDDVLKKTSEVEVVRWKGGGEIWLNDNAIESRLPSFQLKKRNRNP